MSAGNPSKRGRAFFTLDIREAVIVSAGLLAMEALRRHQIGKAHKTDELTADIMRLHRRLEKRLTDVGIEL